MQPPLPGDKTAGFIGLIAGFLSILIAVVVIVQLTNRKFETHGAAPHAPPNAAPHAPAVAPPLTPPGPSPTGAAAPAPAPH
jgi:hypothetical protein